MMQFMRDNRKTLLIIFVVIFAVCFGLPSFFGRNRGQQNKEIATYAGVDGNTTALMSKEMSVAGRQLKALLDMQVPIIMMQAGNYSDTLALINPIASNLVSNAVFSDTRLSLMTRNNLMQTAQYSAQDSNELEDLYVMITKLIDTNRQSIDNYVVLSAEAHRNGYYATAEQVDFITTATRQTINQRNMKMSSVLNSYGLTLTGFQEAVGNLIAIASYVDELTKTGSVNEKELRQMVRDSVEVNNMSGKYVEFFASNFLAKVEEPTDEEIVAQFEQFKAVDPRNIDPEDENNPFGFTYMLPDRIQVEYLNINVTDIKNKLQEEFDAKSLIEQEELLQKYWQEHKTEQQYQTRQYSDDPEAEPTYVQKTFDEAYTSVKRNYVNDMAKEKAQAAMADVRDAVRNDNELLQANLDWQQVADKFTGNIPVAHAISGYLSYETIGTYERLGNAKVTRMNNATLAQVLFSSEPLRDQPASKLDQPPLKLREPLTTVEAGYGTNISDLYIVRIIGVDKAREAVSINDDGRQGGKDIAPIEDDTNLLKEKVAKDIKTLKAYDLALASANEFKTLAANDWAAALETIGNKLKADPADENSPNPLTEKTLDSIYKQNESYRQRMQEQKQYAEYFQRTLTSNYAALNSIMDAYRDADNKDMFIAESKANRAIKVVTDLEITPANQKDLADNKARFAFQTMQKQQFVPLLNLFIQENIDARNAVKFLDKEKQTAKTETETKAEETPAK